MNFQVTTQEFCMVAGYTEDLTNYRTVNIGGRALARGWALARDNTVLKNKALASPGNETSAIVCCYHI